MLTRRGWSLVGRRSACSSAAGSSGSCSSRCSPSRGAPAARGRVRLGARPRAAADRAARPEGAAPGRRRGPRRRRRSQADAAAPRRSPVDDAFDRGRRAARFLLAPLAPGEDGARRVPLPHRPARPLRGRAAARDASPTRSASSSRTRRVLGDRGGHRATRGCTTIVPPPGDGRRRPRPRHAARAAAHRARAASSSRCASTRPATTCATCTGARPRGAAS